MPIKMLYIYRYMLIFLHHNIDITVAIYLLGLDRVSIRITGIGVPPGYIHVNASVLIFFSQIRKVIAGFVSIYIYHVISLEGSSLHGELNLPD